MVTLWSVGGKVKSAPSFGLFREVTDKLGSKAPVPLSVEG